MNIDKKEIMLEMLQESIDDVLRDDGFIRKQNSLLYSKKIGTTKQKINMYFFSYHSTYMQIYPFYSVSFPRINEVAKEMTINDTFLHGVIHDMKNDTIHQPIQHIAKSERWVLVNGKKRTEFVPEIEIFLKQHTIPLLADLECEDDFIKLYEKKDKRIVMGDVEYIFVASAYVLKKDYEKALTVLESRFKTLKRRQYAAVFRYIENVCDCSASHRL